MALYCDFTGSYYNPEPWAEQQCAVETEVPEGCPIHYVSGAPMPFDGWSVASAIERDSTTMQTPNTLSIVGVDEETFSVMDTGSCDCAFTTLHLSFQHLEVDVPAAVAGDTVWLFGPGRGSVQVSITAPAPCPTPEWPAGYSVGLACDRCPEPSDDDEPFEDGPLDVGCAATPDASPLLLAGLAILLVRRRRSR